VKVVASLGDPARQFLDEVLVVLKQTPCRSICYGMLLDFPVSRLTAAGAI
jgi:hypothetical protein